MMGSASYQRRLLKGTDVRKCGPKRFIWYVQVCDYEACWPIAFFDNEAKAEAKRKAYRLNAENCEQSVSIVKVEVF